MIVDSIPTNKHEYGLRLLNRLPLICIVRTLRGDVREKIIANNLIDRGARILQSRISPESKNHYLINHVDSRERGRRPWYIYDEGTT